MVVNANKGCVILVHNRNEAGSEILVQVIATPGGQLLTQFLARSQREIHRRLLAESYVTSGRAESILQIRTEPGVSAPTCP